MLELDASGAQGCNTNRKGLVLWISEDVLPVTRQARGDSSSPEVDTALSKSFHHPVCFLGTLGEPGHFLKRHMGV